MTTDVEQEPEQEVIRPIDMPGRDLRPDDTDEIEKFKEFLGEERDDLTDPNLVLPFIKEPTVETPVVDEGEPSERRRLWYRGRHRAPRRKPKQWFLDVYERLYIWLVGVV